MSLVATTFTSLVLLARSLNLPALATRIDDRFPRRGIHRLLLVVSVVTGLLWGGLPVAALATGGVPAHLEHATTTVEEALSLGLLVPASVLSIASATLHSLSSPVLAQLQ